MTLNPDDYTFVRCTEVILKTQEEAISGTGVVEAILREGPWRSTKHAKDVARELNNTAPPTQHYRVAKWRDSWLKEEQPPQLDQTVDYNSDEATPLGMMSAYKQSEAERIEQIFLAKERLEKLTKELNRNMDKSRTTAIEKEPNLEESMQILKDSLHCGEAKRFGRAPLSPLLRRAVQSFDLADSLRWEREKRPSPEHLPESGQDNGLEI